MATSPCRLALILVPGFSHLGLSLVTEPLFIANWLARRTVYHWTTLSADGLAVPSSSGIMLPVDQPLMPATPFDIALVVASFDPRSGAADSRVLQWLRRAARAGLRIGGVETGCEIVAAAGILDGIETPVHWYNIEGARERLPDMKAASILFSNDGRHPLSAGGMATLDMMLDIIGREQGTDLAREVAAHLLCDGPRPGRRSQPGAGVAALGESAQVGNDPAQAARALIECSLDEPLSIPQIAARVGCSTRNLQRLFRESFGQSMRDLRDDLRMAAAHQRVQQTDLPLTEIAISCGFSSLAAFSRRYRHRFGVPPSQDRRQSTENTVFRLRGNILQN
jgi:AraC family carnitine catabolism transcriptional activator